MTDIKSTVKAKEKHVAYLEEELRELKEKEKRLLKESEKGTEKDNSFILELYSIHLSEVIERLGEELEDVTSHIKQMTAATESENSESKLKPAGSLLKNAEGKKIKFCPLKAVNQNSECIRRKCGWWFEEDDECAVLVVASGISRVGVLSSYELWKSEKS